MMALGGAAVYCECGCGGLAPVATQTDSARGYVLGSPRRFIHNHHTWRPVLVRFWEKVDRRGDAECWPWLAADNGWGYGHFYDGHRGVLAHRFFYELIASVPEGFDLDHLCRNRRCVNPRHLEPVPARINLLRGEGASARNARKTHCIRGHELAGSNVDTRRGDRQCRACRAIYRERYRGKEAERKRNRRLARRLESNQDRTKETLQ